MAKKVESEKEPRVVSVVIDGNLKFVFTEISNFYQSQQKQHVVLFLIQLFWPFLIRINFFKWCQNAQKLTF